MSLNGFGIGVVSGHHGKVMANLQMLSSDCRIYPKIALIKREPWGGGSIGERRNRYKAEKLGFGAGWVFWGIELGGLRFAVWGFRAELKGSRVNVAV